MAATTNSSLTSSWSQPPQAGSEEELTTHQQQQRQQRQNDDDQGDDWLDQEILSEDGSGSRWRRWFLPQRRRRLLRPVDRRLGPNESHTAAGWNSLVHKSRFVLLTLTFLFLWPLGLWSFHTFTKQTDSTFHPIPGSASDLADKAFSRSYPENDWTDPMHPVIIVMLQSTDKNQSLVESNTSAYEVARTFSTGLADHLNQTCWKLPSDKECQPDPNVRVFSYFSLTEEGLGSVAKSLTTPDGDILLMQVQYIISKNVTQPRNRLDLLVDEIEAYGASSANSTYFTVSLTGIKSFQRDLVAATQSDLKRMDFLVLPLALILIGVVLPNARPSLVWIIPLITMITTVSCWSLVMSSLVKRMQITQFTPSIMMSLTMGMGIDYTLFLMSRYLEDAANPAHIDKKRAVRRMIQHGGLVVLLSGLTLMCTFLGLVFLPLDMLKSIGIGAVVAIGCSLIVNLTVVPALLHTQFGLWVVSRKVEQEEPEEVEQEETEELNTNSADVPDSSPRRTVREPVPQNSFWRRLSLHLLHPYKSIIIFLVIIQLLIPVAQFARNMKTSISFYLLMPKNSPSLVAYDTLGEKVGFGKLSSYRILFDGRDANITMQSSAGFDIMHRVLSELMAIDHNDYFSGLTLAERDDEIRNLTDGLVESSVSANDKSRRTSYSGIAYLNNIRISHTLYVSAKYCGIIKPYCPEETLHLIDFVDEAATSKDGFATFTTATLGVNPFSEEGVAWLDSARVTLDRLRKDGAMGGVTVHLQGAAAIAHDAVQEVMRAFPTVVVTTLFVVFLLMAVCFQSVIAPLRSVVSISLTLSFVFGLHVLVYQRGILNFTRIPSLMSSDDAISWLVPVMAFSIIVGLTLDYDVFLISRILEYRNNERFGHKSSIVAGLHSTGGIITAAGMIMALSFGGLMLSGSPVLYQWSFLLTSSVLLDTFVVRSMVVPIITGWTGSLSWWPRKLPDPVITLNGFEDTPNTTTDEDPPTTSAGEDDEPFVTDNHTL